MFLIISKIYLLLFRTHVKIYRDDIVDSINWFYEEKASGT